MSSVDTDSAHATPGRGEQETPRRDPVTDRAREAVRGRLFEHPAASVTVGRFELRDKIGEGGMGVVFTARDAELDRDVAIKLLHSDDDTRSRRLLREAKAMARLTHPNVVTVYEAGTDAGQVYLAMELVRGEDLRRWLDREPRTWRRVLPLLVDAARGLEAAHEAGLVHRDFKPENVLVTFDGRAKVADFGLARAAGSGTTIEDAAVGSDTAVSLATLTRSGMIVGTPAYLPPEVLDGGVADARGDQFSFCVTAYEALLGSRPFKGRTLHELVDNMRRGRIAAGRSSRALPRSLKRALTRGLAVEPDARHASMRELVRLLETELGRRRRVVLAVGAGGAAIGIAAALAWPSPESRCTGGAQAWAEAWSDEQHEAVDAALVATGNPAAGATAERLASMIDAYGTRWIAAHREACLATVRGEQSADELDDEVACLEGRRAHVDALAQSLLAVDRNAVPRALTAAQRLPEIEVCLETDARRGPPLPDDPELRREIQDLQARLALAQVEDDLGAKDQAADLFEQLQDAADALGFRPTMAEVRLARNKAMPPTADARELLYDALYHAEASGYELGEREAWRGLAFVHAYLGEYDASERAARHAEALLEHMGDDPGAAADLLDARAFSKLEQSKFDEALAFSLAAVEKLDARDENDPRLAYLLNSLGTIYTLLERNEDALAAYERAYAIAMAQFGAHHEQVAKSMFDLGRVEARLDNLEESNRWYEQAIAAYAALGASETVPAIFALGNLGQNYGDQGNYAEAMATTEQAIAAMVRVVGPKHRYLVRMRRGLADIYADAGETEKAVAEGEHALEIAEATFGDEHDETASTRRRMGQILLRAGDRERAIEFLERALKGHSAPETPPVHKAITQYWLFAALHDEPAQQDRVRHLAEEAVGPLASSEARDRAQADEMRAWLAAHPK